MLKTKKTSMRDKVAQVRQQISSDFTREQIELALLHYESNVEDTIEAFKKNGAKDALSGWTEMNNRSSTSSRRGGARTRNNNRLVASPTISSSSTSSQISHVPMRPSQLVLNVFNQFANKTQPVTSITNDYFSNNSPATFSTLSLPSSSLIDRNTHVNETPSIYTNNNNNTYDQQQSYLSSSTDVSFHPYCSHESNNYDETLTTDDLQSSLNNKNMEFSDACDDYSLNNPHQTVEEQNDLIMDNSDVNNNKDTDQTQVTRNSHNNKHQLQQRRRHSFRNTRNRTASSSSMNQIQEQIQQQSEDQTFASAAATTTATTNSSTQQHQDVNGTVVKTASKTTLMNNKKVLGKSIKDLQRQTSTLTNVQSSFDNEIKQSIKKIDEIFKQLTVIIKEREVQLYLEMDDVKQQGLNLINRRQQRAAELRGRVDRCDRLDNYGINDLRNDIKQFVTDKRYDLADELKTLHRFEYDENIINILSNFGKVLRIDRKEKDRTRTISSHDNASNNTLANDVMVKDSNNNDISQTTGTISVGQTSTLLDNEEASVNTMNAVEVTPNDQNNYRALSTSSSNDVQSPIQQKPNMNGKPQIRDRATAIYMNNHNYVNGDEQYQPQHVLGDQQSYANSSLTRSHQPLMSSKNHPYGNFYGNEPPNGYKQPMMALSRNGVAAINRQQQQWTNDVDSYYYPQTNGYNNDGYEESNGYYENLYNVDMNYPQQINNRRRRARGGNTFQSSQQLPSPQMNGVVNYFGQGTPNGNRRLNGSGRITQPNSSNNSNIKRSNTPHNISPSTYSNKNINTVNNNRHSNNNAKQVNDRNGYVNDQSPPKHPHNGNNSNEINGNFSHTSNDYSNHRQQQRSNQTSTNISPQQ